MFDRNVVERVLPSETFTKRITNQVLASSYKACGVCGLNAESRYCNIAMKLAKKNE
jgi:hypothetical protein